MLGVIGPREETVPSLLVTFPLLVTPQGDKSIKLWHVKTGLCIKTYFVHTDLVTAVQFHLDGVRMVSGSLDGMVYVH